MHDLFNVGEQSVLKSIKDAFEGEDMLTHCNFYGYKINLYLQGYKLAIKIDELDQNKGIINHEIERKKTIKKELGCEFIRINPDEQNFNIFKAINKIHRHIKRSSKKSLIDKISKRLLELKFELNHSIKAKAIKKGC